jgi:hypothetical protein
MGASHLSLAFYMIKTIDDRRKTATIEKKSPGRNQLRIVAKGRARNWPELGEGISKARVASRLTKVALA